MGEAVGWRELIEKPIQRGDAEGMARLSSLCQQLMLRRTKKGIDAKGQLRLPKQREIVKRLDFSAVEAHFYQQQYEEISRSIRKYLKADISSTDASSSVNECSSSASSSASASASSISSSCASSCANSSASVALQSEQHPRENSPENSSATAEVLSSTLLTLRQAACHPQLGTRGLGTHTLSHSQPQGLGRSKFRRLGGRGVSQVTQKGMQVLTMDQILFKLIDEAKLKCEESQRKWLMQMAASAGVFQVQAELSSRSETPTQVLTAAAHFLSKARGVYAEAMRMYGGNRQPCVVLGSMKISSLPSSLSPPLYFRHNPLPATATVGDNNSVASGGLLSGSAGASYDCRANEIAMCWAGSKNIVFTSSRDTVTDTATFNPSPCPPQDLCEGQTMSVTTLLSASTEEVLGPSALGCQLDNSSAATTAATNRRILQLTYRVDITQAILALLAQQGSAYTQYQDASHRFVCSDLETLCCDAAAEHLGTIYFPSKVIVQAATSGAVFINSHR